MRATAPSYNYPVFHARASVLMPTTSGYLWRIVLLSRRRRRFIEPVSITHRLPRVTLRSFRLFRHVPQRNKSFRGTVQPETDFVRFVHCRSRLSSSMTTTATASSRQRRYIWRSYRARNNLSLLGARRGTIAKQISWPAAKDHRGVVRFTYLFLFCSFIRWVSSAE